MPCFRLQSPTDVRLFDDDANRKVAWGSQLFVEFSGYTEIRILLPVIIRILHGLTEALYKQSLTCRVHKFPTEEHLSRNSKKHIQSRLASAK